MTSLFDNVEIIKRGKIFRIPSETKLQHPIFDRKRQTYLLKAMKRCWDNFSNSVNARRRVSQSLREWLNNHCHKCQTERVMVKFVLEMEPSMKINLVCSTEMFRINIKAASATLSLFSSTRERIILEDRIGLATWMKRNTDMTSLTCAGSATASIFNKG